MAQNNQLPTLLDVLKETGADGMLLDAVPLMEQRHPLMRDLAVIEGNLDMGHTFVNETSVPAPTYQQFNQGILATIGRGDPVTEKCTMLSNRSAVDSNLMSIQREPNAYRMRQEMRILEGIYQEIERGFFYNTTNTHPNRFMGLTPRYNVTSGNPFANQIIKHTGSPSSSDQTSIWLVVHGDDSVFSIYPRGGKGGIQPHPLPEQLIDDGSGTGATFRALVTEWNWFFGLCVMDGRQVVRICNIDTSAISETDFNIVPAMARALHRVHNLNRGKPVFYMNRFMMEKLDMQCLNNSKAVALMGYVEEGKSRLPDNSPSLRGIPIHVTDAITNTEDIVS